VNRLTKRKGGYATFEEEVPKNYIADQWIRCKWQEIIERLAEYEDTGLTPGEVAELKKSKPQWIKCSDRLPELETPVLGFVPLRKALANSQYIIAELVEGYEVNITDKTLSNAEKFYWEDPFADDLKGRTFSDVTHWMALPEVPEEVLE